MGRNDRLYFELLRPGKLLGGALGRVGRGDQATLLVEVPRTQRRTVDTRQQAIANELDPVAMQREHVVGHERERLLAAPAPFPEQVRQIRDDAR